MMPTKQNALNHQKAKESAADKPHSATTMHHVKMVLVYAAIALALVACAHLTGYPIHNCAEVACDQ